MRSVEQKSKRNFGRLKVPKEGVKLMMREAYNHCAISSVAKEFAGVQE